MKHPYYTIFKKHGDILLIALALAVLAGGLIRQAGMIKINPAKTPRIVFTQWWDEDAENGYLRGLADEFESLHEGIKVTVSYMPYKEIMAGLYGQKAIGAMPEMGDDVKGYPGNADVIAIDPLWLPELRPETINEGNGSASNALASFISVLYYNIDILSEAGFSRPPKTRGEFLDYARAIGNGKTRLGLAMGLAGPRGIYDDLYPWIYAAGIHLSREGKASVNSRQVTESLGFFAALNNEDLIGPDARTADSSKKIDDFISGRAAFMVAPASEIERVRKAMGDGAFSVSAVPSPDGYAGRSYYAGSDWAIAINPASRHREEAALFMDFMEGKAALLSEAAHAVSGSGSPPSIADPFYSKVWDIAIAGEQARDFNGLPWNAMEAIFREELASLFQGGALPAEAASAIQAEWENAINSR